MSNQDPNEKELAGLSEEERAAIIVDPDEEANLAAAAAEIAASGDEEHAPGDDDKGAAGADAAADAAKVAEDAAVKAATDKAAAEAAQKAAQEAADDAEAQEAAKAAKEAAEASEKAATDAKAAADKAASDKAAAEASAAAAAAATTTDDEEDAPFVATYTAPPVEKYDEKITALDTREADASTKFKAGEMDFAAYQDESKAIEKERRELNEAHLKHTIASEQQIQSSEQRWVWEINRFYRRVERDEHIAYGKSSLLLAALDTRVKELANDKANSDKDSTWFLEEAHRQIKTELGIGKKSAAGESDAAAKAAAEARAKADAEAKAKAAAARKPERKSIPKDLGGLPAGGKEDAGGEDEFAALDALEGIELENALARLPKEKADRYLTGL